MALSNEEELFTEASGELQREVEESLENARESLPAREALMTEEQTALNTVVAGLPAELDPSESSEALRTAQKRFALGEQAAAFDEEFSAEMRTALDELEDAVDALQTVGDTAPELAGALTTLHGVHPESEAAQTDSPVTELEESGVAESSSGSEEHSPDESDAHSDETQQTINDESEMTDEDSGGNEVRKEDDEADSDD
jgi:hypothetical protein